jgi:hypothetical protein
MISGVVLAWTAADLTVRVIAIAIGAVLLLLGRRLTWLFSGVASFLLALLVIRLVTGDLLGSRALSANLSWVDLIAVLAALLGVVAAFTRSDLAFGVIGATTGGALCVWTAQVVVVNGSSATFWLVVVIVACMALGAFFTIHYGEVALILLSAAAGVVIIAGALGLNGTAQWEAVLCLSLALLSVAAQSHDYLLDGGLTARLP